MNDINKMPPKCQYCPYWEICRPPYICPDIGDMEPKRTEKRTETHASDCISRQALCEYALNQKDKNITANDIMRFPSAQRWIPISKKLPKNGHNYLYCTDMGTVHMGFYWGGLGFGYGFDYGYNIVAWMPLPEPYKGGEHETD